MVVDPWGQVIAEQEEGKGIVVADIDLVKLDEVRKNMPVAQHRRV